MEERDDIEHKISFKIKFEAPRVDQIKPEIVPYIKKIDYSGNVLIRFNAEMNDVREDESSEKTD